MLTMAMAATPLYSSSSMLSKSTINKPLLNSRTHFIKHLVLVPSSSPVTLKSKPLTPAPATATTTAAIEMDTTSTTPSKTLPFRVGHGFDLHRLEPGYPLIIGGITIPHDRGCEAHSDGDVLLHCVVDAILGALGLPDIGQIFPDTDPKWKGAASSHLHQRSCETRARGRL